MRTAVRLGAVAINYVEADELETNGGLVGAIVARDVQTQERFELRAKVVFNDRRVGRRLAPSCA